MEKTNYQPGIDEGYEELANAIVFRAVSDYRRLLKGKNLTHKAAAKYNLLELERFFKSKWFELLTRVDGEMLMERLQAECKNKRRKTHEN